MRKLVRSGLDVPAKADGGSDMAHEPSGGVDIGSPLWDLLEDLRQFQGYQKIVDGVLGVLGMGHVPALGHITPNSCPVKVYGHLLDPTGVVFQAYIVTSGGFSLFEVAGDGRSLCQTYPLRSVRRISESSDGPGTGELLVEVEADSFAYDEQFVSSGPGDGTDAQVLRRFVAKPVACTVTAKAGQFGDYAKLARGLRVALALA